MTRLAKVEKIDNGIEELILTGMIVDDDFLNRFSTIAKPEFFESDMISIITEWILDYGQHNDWQAPKENIQSLYKMNKDDFDEDEAKSVRIFLKRLVEKYKDRPFNGLYVEKRAIPYMKKQAYKFYVDKADKLLERDRVDEAVELFEDIPRKVVENVKNWIDFSDPSLVNTWWSNMTNSIIKFPNDLGRYLPRIRPGKFYTLLAPAKRGKSFWLLYWAYIAAMDGLNVTVFSLEMEADEVHERISKMISGMAPGENEEEEYWLPVLDCIHNQTGECERKECRSPETVVAEYAGKELDVYPFEGNEDHLPCSECKGSERFKATSWFEKFTQETLSKRKAKQMNKQFKDHISGEKLKIISYPIGTVSPLDIEQDLDSLERTGFHSDLVVIDYAQIMKMDRSINDKRNQINNVYQECSRIAKSRGCTVVSASQGNRGSAKKNRLDPDDVAEDWGIIMIIDAIIAINEENFEKASVTHTDKYWQRQRLETLALRYGKFLPGKQCLVLNDFERAQINIDSCIL